MRAGMASSISASSDGAPTVFSIAAVSSASGPMCRDWNDSKSRSMLGLRAERSGLLDESLVLRGVEERAGFARDGQFDHDHPAVMRVLVDRLRLVLERRVDLEDLAGDRRVEFGDRLHRFDRAEGLPLLHLRPDLGQLDIDDVAELLLGVVGDADAALVGREVDPLVVLGVFEASRIRHRWSPPGPKGPGLLLSLVKRHRYDARAGAAAADVDVELGVWRGVLDRQIRHADGLLQVRRLRAAGDDPGFRVADVGVVAVTADAALEHLEADDLARRAARLLLAQRAGADEVVFLPADDPVEVRFDRGRRLVDVVAVEAHAGFEAQRVARAEAAGNDVGGFAGLEQRQPDFVRLRRRDEDFEAVFAGVAGARDGGADVGDLAVSEPVVLHAREIDAGQRLEHFQRFGALDGDQRIARARIDGHRIADTLDVLGHPRVVLRDVPRVDDEEEMRGTETVHEQVVDERALRREQAGVLRLPDLQLRRVVRRDALDRRERVLAGDLDLAHVADVEDPGAGAHGRVFVREAAVLDGHVPAAERDHFGSRGAVAGVERRFL